jgi:RHS repeat-associated protein
MGGTGFRTAAYFPLSFGWVAPVSDNSIGPGDNTAFLDLVTVQSIMWNRDAEDTTTNRPLYFYTLDNLGETTEIGQYQANGLPASDFPPVPSRLRADTQNSFDNQGRVYQARQYNVNQLNGSVAPVPLQTNLFYDHRGNQIAAYAPGGLVTKDEFDGAARLIAESQTDGSGGMTWSAAGTLDGDLVLIQSLTTYDGDSNPILATTKQRFDDEVATGALGDPNTAPRARVYFVASYFDAANRLTATVNAGTNGGQPYTRPDQPASRSDAELVTSFAYNPAGWVQTVTDPRGIVARSLYDALGRPTQTIAAFTDGVPTGSTNQTTNTTYDGVDHVLTVQALQSGAAPPQTTQYVYGVSPAFGNGVMYSNDIQAQLRYPDPATGGPSTSASNQVAYRTDAIGEVTGMTDPNGTAHVSAFDPLNRPIGDTVAALGPNVDGTVRQLATAYDQGLRPFLFSSLDAPSVFPAFQIGSAALPVNQVQDTYNGLGQLTNEYQEQAGAVNVATSPQVRYAYTEMAGGQNNSRPTSMTYPSGRVIDFVYAPGLDERISRLTELADDNAGSPGTVLEGYKYLGLSTIVERDHPEPGLNLTYIYQPGQTATITDGGDKYTGLDRFGRVVDLNWFWSSLPGIGERFQYAYDRDGNTLYQKDLANAFQSELYYPNSMPPGDRNMGYDPLGRMTAFARGVLSLTNDSIPNPSRTQEWGLDALGNWSSIATNGAAINRTFDAQNKTTGVAPGTAPTYDPNGNTTSDSGQSYAFDPWNRLVSASTVAGVVASYAYDALGRRVIESYPGSATTNHLYYSPQWQVIEERKNGTAVSNLSQQYVWSLAYVDAIVLRDSFSDGFRTQRLYALQNANFDTMGVVDQRGAMQERFEYDPYGSVTYLYPNWVPRNPNESVVGWRYLYQGGRLDSQTGWFGFRNRDLIPSEGRWAERDPAGIIANDPNAYRYVNNAPAALLDPSGLQGIQQQPDFQSALVELFPFDSGTRIRKALLQDPGFKNWLAYVNSTGFTIRFVIRNTGMEAFPGKTTVDKSTKTITITLNPRFEYPRECWNGPADDPFNRLGQNLETLLHEMIHAIVLARAVTPAATPDLYPFTPAVGDFSTDQSIRLRRQPRGRRPTGPPLYTNGFDKPNRDVMNANFGVDALYGRPNAVQQYTDINKAAQKALNELIDFILAAARVAWNPRTIVGDPFQKSCPMPRKPTWPLPIAF